MAKIALTGGGTGGHIYPGLAVAEYLREKSAPELLWIGKNSGMDRSIVEEAGIPFAGIPAGKLRRYPSMRTLTDAFRVVMGFFAARRILKKERPDLLFSKGGFVSVPPCAAAKSLGIPVFTHESDFSPGLATRINCRFASRVFTAYGDTIALLPSEHRPKAIAVGNPVRAGFYRAHAERGRAFLGISGEKPVLLALGGSQGAFEINELVKAALPELTRAFTVIHQCGKTWDAPPADKDYRPYPYISAEMPDVIAAASLILGRSGAGTVWECAASGKPMALIPLRGAGTRGDQVENAEYFEKAGAAVIFTPKGDGSDAGNLARLLTSLAADKQALEAMAAAASKIGEQRAAETIGEELTRFLNSAG